MKQQSKDFATSANAPLWRSPVEEVLMGHIEKIRDANKLDNFEQTYDHIIEHWYMYDSTWLSMIRHMHDHGRFR